MSRRMRSDALGWLAAACLVPILCGCGPIGRELVGEYKEDNGLAPCPLPLECDEQFQETNAIELSAVEIAPMGDLCEQLPDPEPEQLSRAAIAPGSSEAEVAGGELLPGAPAIGNGEPEPTRFECARLELRGREPGDEPGDVATEEVGLPGIDLYAVEITLHSETPMTVVMRGARLREVSILLRGSVVLRVERSLAFDGVRIGSEALDSKRPRVELEEVHGDRLLVGTRERPIAGGLLLARSHLQRSRLFASRVEIESARMSDLAVDTDELEGTGASIDRARLGFGEAVLSGSALSRVQVASCGSFTSIWSTVEGSQISACTEGPFHAYSTTVNGGFVDGPIDADRAELYDVLLGLYEQTDFWGRDITIKGATLCGGSRRLRLGGGSAISCTDCRKADLAEPDAACIFPDTFLEAVGNNCPELDRIMLCPASVPPTLMAPIL